MKTPLKKTVTVLGYNRAMISTAEIVFLSPCLLIHTQTRVHIKATNIQAYIEQSPNIFTAIKDITHIS